MARNVSDEELQLKKRARRRLVGAIVLATAVAVVLPMILDSEPRPANQSIDIQIPSPDAGVLSARPAPLKPAESTGVATAPAPTQKAEEKPESKPGAEAKPEPKAEPRSEPKPATAPAKPVTIPEAKAKPGESAPAKAKSVAGSFVIQVVALSDTGRARELQKKISAAGMKAYTEVVQTEKGPVTRVRVGPYSSREAAEKGRQQLQRLQLDGKVVSL